MKDVIRQEIARMSRESEENWFEEIDAHYFDEPIVQSASADDPLFEDYKRVVDPGHLTPKEALELSFGEGSHAGGSVISVVLPINEKIRESNRPRTDHPSRIWALFNINGGKFPKKLLRYLEDYLNRQGYRTVAPYFAEWYRQYATATYGPGSNWSERHIAYAAGLGSFSLNEGFISERGIAIRLLSVVTELLLPPDLREGHNHRENCLFDSKEICGACIRRCPVNALSREGHDKVKCRNHAYGEDMKKLAASYGASPGVTAGCSLCQTSVPCEYRNPMRPR